MRNLKIAGWILGVCLAIALPASAQGRFHRNIVVVPSFSYGAWGWRDPFPYYGIYGPYGAYAPVYTNAGEIVLKTNVKDADVFINGAYAGKAGKLKSMWLRADSYSLEIRAPGQPPFTERIYVVPGKTLKIHADFPSTPHS